MRDWRKWRGAVTAVARRLWPRGRAMLRAGAVGSVGALAVAVIVVGFGVASGMRGQASRPASVPAAARHARGAADPPRLPPHADPLGLAAASYLRGRTGSVLAAVEDVRTGQTWTLGDGRAQAAASVVKLDILEALLSGSPGGLPASQAPLAREMIEDSDNDAATTLWDAVGGATGIGSFDSAAGLSGTAPSSCVRCPGFAWPGWGLTRTTPADQLALLRQLVVGGPPALLTSAEREYALSLLENVTPGQRWGVSGGVPPGVTVALKDGWLPLNSAATDWQVNSVGWISGDGRDYLIAVMSTGNPSEQYGITTVSALGTLAWNAMR